MPETDSLLYKIAFASMRGMSPGVARHVLALVGSEIAFFNASEATLAAAGLKPVLADARLRLKALEKARVECEFIISNSIRPLYFTDAGYPRRMAALDDAPMLIYALGSADLNRGRMIGIVGTRSATAYGVDFCNRLIRDLADSMKEPLTVISGLAFGIDGAAHKSAIAAGVPTVGVLAHGLDTIYPAQHRGLAADMARNGGLLLTEYPHGATVHKGNFLARNRIVAALSDLIVVVESADKGGALVTARLAGEYGRAVFALPGRISDRYSQGCNTMIADGRARMVTSAADITDYMNWPVKEAFPEQPSLFPELSDDERAVMTLLEHDGEAHISGISSVLGLPAPKVSALMIEMEFKGLILPFPGGKYRLK